MVTSSVKLNLPSCNCCRKRQLSPFLGPRQCGKTTLAREVVAARPDAVYLDLERPSDQRRLTDPELYFRAQREQGVRLFCLDEIQLQPEIFSVLRSVIDESSDNGQFLLLGSASRGVDPANLRKPGRTTAIPGAGSAHRDRGADGKRRRSSRPLEPRRLSRSYLAPSDAASYRWRQSFVRTFLERDIPQLGFDIPAATLHRLWRMLAHHHGQALNSSSLGGALGVSHTTIRSWLDLLSQTFMIRLLEPTETNLGKRLVKSPKVYIRDAGLLHALLEVENGDALFGHPALGASWEGLAIESALASASSWRPSFYRTTNGAEIDLVLERGQRKLAIECKASSAPTVTRGFWQSLDDLQIDQAYVVAPVDQAYPLKPNVEVCPLRDLVKHLEPNEE